MVAVVFSVLGAPGIVLATTSNSLEDAEITVSYADLNLGNEAGVQALYRRLKRASKEVCEVTSSENNGSVSQMQRAKQCFRNTLTNAVESIDNDLLTRIHAS